MKKGKSIYTFQLNCDPVLVNNLIQSYMKSNNYKLQDVKGEQYYRAGDAMVGYTYFNYSLSGQTLTIYAWLKSLLGPVSLEKQKLNMFVMSYRNSLNTLFQEIDKLNNSKKINTNEIQKEFNYNNTATMSNSSNNLTTSSTSTMQDVKNNTQAQTQNSFDEFSQSFQQETIKRQEKMCEIGFWLSILGVIISLTGIAYGIFVYIMNFYFAFQGLKTRKRGKAIASIVFSIISIVIFLFQLIIAVILL